MSVSVLIPVHRAGAALPRLLDALGRQQPAIDELIVAETDPEPGVQDLVKGLGGHHLAVAAGDYDHAGTRTALARQSTGDILVLFSQDVAPADDQAIARLVAPLQAALRTGGDPLAASYGRQLCEPGAPPLMALKRAYLYPDQDDERGLADRARLGFRTVQMSNAFAAYRRDALAEIGWFGERQLVCEDVSATSRLLQAGYRVRYVAGAVAIHAHHASFVNELKRYFDIGAAYQHDPTLFGSFGQPRREGWRYLQFGLRRLASSGQRRSLPLFLLQSAGKRLFFALGRHSDSLPRSWPARLSTLPQWWNRKSDQSKFEREH